MCCDAAVVYRYGTVTAAAVVDGIGSDRRVAEWAGVAAQTATRVGARRGAVLGILAAAELTAGEDMDADGVAVLAVLDGDGTVGIAWTGDSRAYAWTGDTLRQLTTDMTMAEYLRRNGFALDTPCDHDAWITATLGRSSVATVHHAHPDTEGLVLLTSDGVHDQLRHEDMADIVRAHAADPQALADALVAAVEDDEDGYRDDATAVVLLPTGSDT